MPVLYLATTNPGKIREFREAAQHIALELESFPNLKSIPAPVEDGETFEDNARIKAEYYSRLLPAELVLAEDSGLCVDELNGAPGVYSARYAAILRNGTGTHTNSSDEDNNRALIAQLERLSPQNRAGKYVSVIALAREGKVLKTFSGEAHGTLLTEPRGTGGFGYDPLFYFPSAQKTFAELALDEKRRYSHRGNAIRSFVEWASANRL